LTPLIDCISLLLSIVYWLGEGVANTAKKNSSIVSVTWMSVGVWNEGNKTFLKQNHSVCNSGCRLTQVNLYNVCETVVIVIVCSY